MRKAKISYMFGEKNRKKKSFSRSQNKTIRRLM